MTRPISFPKSFLWGASLSAHQAEGGNYNQWTVWELENARSLATQAPYQYEDLDSWTQISPSAKRPGNYVSNRASDHLVRYEEDFDILESLNLNTLRFSIEWSRIEPEEGKWNAGAISHYKNYLMSLKRRKITPVVTLFHFSLPVWFAEKGGFAKRSNIKDFLRFVDKVLEEFGPHIKFIVTVNEPVQYVSHGYLSGTWPPNISNRWLAWRVIRNLLSAHRQAAAMIHKRSKRYRVSMAHNLSYIYAGDDAWLSQFSARVMDYVFNQYMLKRSLKSSDYMAVNYYFSDRVYGYRIHNPNQRINDLGWDMQPSNIQYILEEASERYKLPIIITENGLADAEDKHRSWWLSETLRAISAARENGADVRGYVHWSLIDNFEWDKGRWPRFGLVAVDYRTMQRTVRPSAKSLAKLIPRITKR